MSMLLLQTFLLMLTAFFLGALVACLVKSVVSDGAAETRGESAAAVAPPRAPTPMPPQPLPPRPAPDLVRPRIETVARPTTAPTMPIPDAQRFERALRQQAAGVPAAAKPPQPVTEAPTVRPAATGAAALVSPPPPASVVPRVEIRPPEPLRGSAPAAPPAPAPAGKGGDGIAAAVAAAAAMAATRAQRVEPAPPAPKAEAPPIVIMPAAAGSAGPASVAVDVSMQPAPGAPVATPQPAADDDLTRIRAIDPALRGRLNALDVRRYEQIARWSSADVQRIGTELGIARQIASENWIEQAQVLARGEQTDYVRRQAATLAGLSIAAPTADEGAPPARAPAAAAPAPAVFELPKLGAQAAAAAAAAIAAAAAASARRGELAGTSATVAAARDNLQRIHGVDARTEALLYAEGVTKFAQIAAWTAADTVRFGALIEAPGRISRENWIEQAAILAGSGATAYTRRTDAAAPRADAEVSRPARLADAIRERESLAKSADAPPSRPASTGSRPDLASLRSVRSEALRGAAAPGGAADDLKRIRGIGVLIEKRLNSIGVSTFEQVANWTGADVDRISQMLDFKGRIEREGWIEQARILASGGDTEFSLRVDKGDA